MIKGEWEGVRMKGKAFAEQIAAVKNGHTTPVPDFEGCGVGRGAKCCVFFIVGAEGPHCERWGPLHEMLVEKQPGMSAKRMPVAPWPACMVFREVAQTSNSIN